MLGKFFDTSAVDTFATWVVAELSKSIPPGRIDDASKQIAKRREQVDERIRRHVQGLASTERLNIYQKAKLGTRLQQALEAAGYTQAFSKPFAYAVVKLVAVASTQPR
jgi:hypothetical protein